MFAPLILGACSENLFGSSAQSGKSNCEDRDLDCLQIEAEELFRAGKYKESYKTYEKIVNADPKRSVGYFGMAKAGLWSDSVTIFNFMGLSKDTKDLDGSDPTKIAEFFQKELGVKSQNRYLQGSKKADRALRELSRRDSLTEMYNNYLDPKFLNGKNDSIKTLYESFATTYCLTKPCKDPLNEDEKFPLSDMKYRRTDFSIGYAVSALMRTILGSIVFDLFGNGCIFSFDDKPPNPIEYGCNSSSLKPSIDLDLEMSSIITFDENGMIQVDFDKLYDNLLNDDGSETALVGELNERFENLTGDIEELVDLIGTITGGVYQGDNGDAVTQDSLQKQLNEFKDYALFVRLNDGIDNDGDGCIDEELAVGGKAYDTDGDGFFGEDLRIIPVPPFAWDCSISSQYRKICTFSPPSSGKQNFINPQRDFFIMDIQQYAGGEADTIVRGAWSNEPGFWVEDFLRLDDMARHELKKEIQVEKKECWPLAKRISELGGCWKRYSDTDFKNYRNNPLQIEKGGMNPGCKEFY